MPRNHSIFCSRSAPSLGFGLQCCLLTAGTLLLAHCGDDSGARSDGAVAEPVDAGGVALQASHIDTFDTPVAGATEDETRAFNRGDELFDLPLRDSDGLGPLYTRNNCGGCHGDGLRGPGLVQKMSIVEADGITPAADQSALPYGHTVHPLTAGGGKTPITAPRDLPSLKVSIRVGPPVLGRGYMEAVMDSEIVRMADEQALRDDAIRGRVNYVTYKSEDNPDTRFHTNHKGDSVIGRFGLKARIATLDDFTADALQGDMGATSPLRPTEIRNPDGLLDDGKPGIDISIDSLNARAMYTRLLAIPRRGAATDDVEADFAAVKCAACHVPTLRTRADYPIAVLADIDAPIYTDMLLHDVGDDLADGMGHDVDDGDAGPREFRTAPLIGLRFYKTFLHDGRAKSVEDAIFAHDSAGSEASESVALYRALPDDQRAALLAFVESL